MRISNRKDLIQDIRVWERMAAEFQALSDFAAKILCDEEYNAIMKKRHGINSTSSAILLTL